MELIQFGNNLSSKDPNGPPFKLRVKDLDANFRKLRPIVQDGNNRQYSIEETPDGWILKLFPDAPATNLSSLLQLMANMTAVEVERCDGKKMTVIGTDWY